MGEDNTEGRGGHTPPCGDADVAHVKLSPQMFEQIKNIQLNNGGSSDFNLSPWFQVQP